MSFNDENWLHEALIERRKSSHQRHEEDYKRGNSSWKTVRWTEGITSLLRNQREPKGSDYQWLQRGNVSCRRALWLGSPLGTYNLIPKGSSEPQPSMMHYNGGEKLSWDIHHGYLRKGWRPAFLETSWKPREHPSWRPKETIAPGQERTGHAETELGPAWTRRLINIGRYASVPELTIMGILLNFLWSFSHAEKKWNHHRTEDISSGWPFMNIQHKVPRQHAGGTYTYTRGMRMRNNPKSNSKKSQSWTTGEDITEEKSWLGNSTG